jgi:predicted AlkP superfamily phosphohydrolase/phosphomutase
VQIFTFLKQAEKIIKSYKFAIVILIIILLQVEVFSVESHNNDDSNTSNNTHIKIVLIGLDGLEWSIINELVKENKLPTFAKLIQEGTYGNLKIFQKDYLSPALWTTMVTGKKPEVHGILGFLLHEKDKYGTVVPRTYHRKVKALWNILSECGRKAGVINYFATWPPEKINGFIVPNLNSRLVSLKSSDVFPSSLVNEINFLIKSYRYDNNNLNSDFFEEQAKDINVTIDILKTVSPYLYQKFNNDLDLLIVYTHKTDDVQHFFWKFMEPEYFQHPAWGLNPENIEKYGDFIKDIYRKIDEMVKEIIKYIDEETVVIICSDHGFQRGRSAPIVRLDNLDKLLAFYGFLTFSRNDIKLQGIDFSKTKAYHYQLDPTRLPFNTGLPFALISINLRGRQPQGIVAPGDEYFRLKRQLIDILSNLRVLETGEKLFTEVSEISFERADIAIFIKNNIDLLKQHIKINNDIYPLNIFYTFKKMSGDHLMHKGVIIIYGNNIKKAKLIEGAHILDITPTILYLLGLPIAKDMEGKVLTQAIDTKFLESNPIKYIDTYEVEKKYNRKEFISQPIDKKQLEKLKSLGYIQ